jgi:hypothetical protein
VCVCVHANARFFLKKSWFYSFFAVSTSVKFVVTRCVPGSNNQWNGCYQRWQIKKKQICVISRCAVSYLQFQLNMCLKSRRTGSLKELQYNRTVLELLKKFSLKFFCYSAHLYYLPTISISIEKTVVAWYGNWNTGILQLYAIWSLHACCLLKSKAVHSLKASVNFWQTTHCGILSQKTVFLFYIATTVGTSNPTNMPLFF